MAPTDGASRSIAARCCTLIDLLKDELNRCNGCTDSEWSDIKNAIQHADECRKHLASYVTTSLTAIGYYDKK